MTNKAVKNIENNIKENSIILFKEKQIRRIWHNKQLWFSVSDACSVLADSINGKAYWRKLKQRLKNEGSEIVTNCHELKLISSDGKKYLTDCANTEGIFRIIQSIPSPKAEPFKQWLAKIGYERIQEIEDPELAQIRMKSLYEQNGYPQDWIDKRFRGMAVRQNLTDEWQERGGAIAGNARLSTEKELKRSIISKENYLELSSSEKIQNKNKK